MEKRQRMTLLGIAAAIAVAAVVIALVAGGGTDDSGDSDTSNTQAAETQGAGADTTQSTTPDKPKPKPEVTQIEVKGGEPVGGVEDVQAKKGDTVRLAVRADVPDHVHLHGYDVMRDIAPGKPAKLNFKANIEGVFEVELEDSGVTIAEITVNP
jgi:hypothetical protein